MQSRTAAAAQKPPSQMLVTYIKDTFKKRLMYRSKTKLDALMRFLNYYTRQIYLK